MKSLVNALAAMVRRSPVGVIVGALAITVVLGFFLPQAEQSSGNEGFSPDTPEFIAGDIIADRFETSAVAAVQIVFTNEGGDVLTADAFRSYLAVSEAVRASEVGPVLVDGRQAIQGFFDPAAVALQQSGLDPASLTDADVKQLYLEGLEAFPPEVQGQLTLALSSENTDLTVPESTAGLMIVLIDSSKIPDDPDQVKLQAAEVDMQTRIAEAEVTGVDATPFSFALLFANQDEFQSEIGRLFGSAFLIIVIILGFVFWVTPSGSLSRLKAFRRAAADVSLAMLVIVLSILWMNGIGVLLGPKYLGLIGNFSEILQIIPILLIGLGVDYAIHLTSRYREEVGEHDDEAVAYAASAATRTVGVALVLATVTTGVGFLTNVFNPITAIADFGVLATVGITSAFILMLTVVPSVRVLLDRRAERAGTLPVEALGTTPDRVLPKIMGRTSVLSEKIPVVMVAIALALGGLGFYGLTQLSTEFSFTDFLPEDSPLLATFDVLVEEFGGGLGETTNVLIQGDVATPEVHNGLVQAWANLDGVENVLSFGPRAAAESPVSVIAQLVVPPEQGGNPELYNPAFAQEAAGLGLQPDLTVAANANVAALYDAADAVDPENMVRVAAKDAGGSYELVNVAVATQAGESGARDIKTDLAEAFAPVASIEGVTATPTNENIIGAGVVDALQESQVSSIAISLLAAMALLVLNFWYSVRRPLLGVITIFPVILVVLWVFGMMSLTGISFNPVTAMIAAIAIGIGVPYTIHITHRYQEDRTRYASENDAMRETMTHTGGALAGSAFTTVAGFGILVTSSLKPFQQLGLVTAYAIGGALIAAVLVLPSMLVLWDRWRRRNGDKPEAIRGEQEFAAAP